MLVCCVLRAARINAYAYTTATQSSAAFCDRTASSQSTCSVWDGVFDGNMGSRDPRTNSQQSIRIRSLENDCSRLLAENLSLREQVLHLHNAAESQASRLSMENIDAVKTQLEAKLLELGGMVAQLGQLKKTGDRSRRKSQQLATRRSAGERQWRSGLGLQEVENQMLPTIAEGKHYPRQTMGYVYAIC